MINFLKNKNIYFIVSAAIILAGVIAYIVFGGLNFGLDFSGGTEIRMNIGKDYSNNEIAAIVKQETGKDCSVQKSGANNQEVIIKLLEIETTDRDKLVGAIKTKYSLTDDALLEANNVSAAASTKLLTDALRAIIWSFIFMLIYITIRFDLKSGLAAIIGLLHNILIMIAVYAIFRLQINSTYIAAILTIVGYSINNTIIIFDKIRENRKFARKVAFEDVSNKSLNQVLVRTINASVTTLLTITVLYIMGIESIREFALPIIVGVAVGTYSSIFISTPLWVLFFNAGAKKKHA